MSGRHGITRERHERLVAGDSRNHAGVVADRRLVARDGGIEIGQHLEQLPEIRVGGAQELVEAAVADQHHLDVDRDRVGLEEQRAEGGGELGRDDLQHARPQAAQQHLPGAGLGKHVARLQNQEAAVCLEQRSPLDRHVVCVRAALGHEIALDLAEEVPERGRALDHDRAAGCGVVLEDQVRPISAGRGLDLVEGTEPLHQIGHHVGEEVAHRRRVERGLDRIDVVAESAAGLGLQQRTQLRPMVRSDFANLVAKFLELECERTDAFANALDRFRFDLALGPKRLELLKRNRLAVHDRQDVGLHAARHRARDQREAVGTQLLFERCAELSHRLLGALVERRAPGADGLRIQDLGQLLFDELDQTIDAAAEVASAPARKGNQSRPTGLGKIVDIASVFRQRAAGADVFQQLANQALSSGACDAAHIDILARCKDFESVAQRLDRVVLANDASDGLDLVGGPERRQQRGAAPAEHVCAERLACAESRNHHGSPHSRPFHMDASIWTYVDAPFRCKRFSVR